MESNDTNERMRFSFLTNARTMGTMGLVAGLVGVIAGLFVPGVGLVFGAEAVAMALIGHRQQKKRDGGGKTVYVAMGLGLTAMLVSVVLILLAAGGGQLT